MKISKEKLTLLKNTHIITLELIHEMLEVKQRINNYQRNTNKKYGLNLEKDEVINREVADMIIINTLGKLNMLAEQSYFLRLVRNTEVNSPKIRKAEKFAKKANLADKIVESLDFIFYSGTISFDEEALFNFIKNQNVQNIEYFISKGRQDCISNLVKWLLDTYKEEQK